MSKALFALIYFQIPIIVFCQTFRIGGQVCDSESRQGLPFANIMVSGFAVGTTTDKNGFFDFALNDSLQNEYLIISFVGYTPVKMKIKDLESNTVLLIQDLHEIGEVIIRPLKKKPKPLIINDYKDKECELRYSISPFDSTGDLHIPYRPDEPTIEAIYFRYDPDYGDRTRLKEVKLNVTNMGLYRSVFRLRLYDVSDDGSPDKDIIPKPIIVQVLENEHTIKVNLEEFNIFITEPGLFIGFELLIIPDNMQIIENKSGKTAKMYSPFLRQIRTDVVGDYWIYSGGEWRLSKYWYYKRGIWFMTDKKVVTDRKTAGPIMFKPAISLILTD